VKVKSTMAVSVDRAARYKQWLSDRLVPSADDVYFRQVVRQWIDEVYEEHRGDDPVCTALCSGTWWDYAKLVSSMGYPVMIRMPDDTTEPVTGGLVQALDDALVLGYSWVEPLGDGTGW
jgi:hypothetical protein